MKTCVLSKKNNISISTTLSAVITSENQIRFSSILPLKAPFRLGLHVSAYQVLGYKYKISKIRESPDLVIIAKC